MFIKSSVPLAQQCYQYLSECFATMLCDFLYTQKSFTVLKGRNKNKTTLALLFHECFQFIIREILQQCNWICFKFSNALYCFLAKMHRKPLFLLLHECCKFIFERFYNNAIESVLYTQKSFTVLKRNNVYKNISSVVSRVLSIHIREILKQYIWICFKFPNALNYFKVNMVRKPQVLLLHECYQYLWYYKNIRRISFIYQNALYCLEANTI